MSQKKQLRKKMKELLSSQSVEECKKKSQSMAVSLGAISDYSRANVILLYVSTGQEVSTRELITEALANGKRVVIPAVDPETEIVTLHEIGSLEELEPGYMGIPEPRNSKTVFSSAEVECAVVPGLAFDAKGNRLGRGKAMFDKLLSRMKCLKIALAFEFQVLESVPSLPHDVPVDIVITEERTIKVYRRDE